MFEKILVPLDGSSFAESALPVASALVERGGALRLLAVDEPSPWALTALPSAAGSGYLDDVRRARIPPDRPTTVAVRRGTAHEEILREADRCDADLIVMATHGRGAVSRFWLGGVAERVLRRARVPVLLVRPRPSAVTSDRPIIPARVAVPLDGSVAAACALGPARALAQAIGARLELIRVVPQHGPGLAEMRRRAGSGLAEVVERGRPWPTPISTDVIEDTHPAHAILQAAGQDAVVMTKHVRAHGSADLLGGVTDKVLRGSTGLVLVVPPRDEPARSLEERVARSLDAEPGRPAVPFGGAIPWALP